MYAKGRKYDFQFHHRINFDRFLDIYLYVHLSFKQIKYSNVGKQKPYGGCLLRYGKLLLETLRFGPVYLKHPRFIKIHRSL